MIFPLPRIATHIRPVLRRTGPDHIISHHRRSLIQQTKLLAELQIGLVERFVVVQEEEVDLLNLPLRFQLAQGVCRGASNDCDEVREPSDGDQLLSYPCELGLELQGPDVEPPCRVDAPAKGMRKKDSGVA